MNAPKRRVRQRGQWGTAETHPQTEGGLHKFGLSVAKLTALLGKPSLVYRPCAICGEPSTKASDYNARSKGGTPYCEKHKRGSKELHLLPCAICGEPSTEESTKGVGKDRAKPYCERHRGGPHAVKELLPCSTCGKPSTHTSSQNARNGGTKPFCTKHRGGSKAPKELLPCDVCGEPATSASCKRVRSRGGKPYCEKHAWGSKKRDRTFDSVDEELIAYFEETGQRPTGRTHRKLQNWLYYHDSSVSERCDKFGMPAFSNAPKGVRRA